MPDWSGIDLRGRVMLHAPWCREELASEHFFCPAETVIEIASAFKTAGGSVTDLVQLLNQHLPPGAEKLNENEIFNTGNSYSLEFQFYLTQFTKQLLNDPMFCFILPDDNPLSIHHLVYEKGPIEFPPWIVDDGQDKDGYMSITNLSAMFIYLEEKYTCDFIAEGSRTLGRRLSAEALMFLNRAIPEEYNTDRNFYDKEGILISWEFLCYAGEILRALTNEEMILINSYYYSFLNHNQLARAIFLQTELSPVEGFMEWQRRTNNIHKMEFKIRRRTLWIRLDFSSLVKVGMISTYRKSMIKRLEEGAPIIHRVFLELATGKKVKYDLIYDKKNELVLTVRLRWKQPYSSANSILAGVLSIFFITGISVLCKLFLKPQMSFGITTVITALIAGGTSAVALTFRNKLKATRLRFRSSKNVIDKQLESLKELSNELLRERNLLESKVAERTSELNGAFEKLKALDRGKTNFIANVSHELRTPLTLLSVPLEGIKSGSYGKNISSDHPVFNLLERNVGRLKTQINQLLDFTRLDLNTMPFEPRPIDLISYCRGIVAELESLAERKSLYLEIDNRTLLDELFISADNSLLETVLLNLLNNALKFTDTGGIKIVFSNTAGSDSLVLTIMDTGIGFSPEEKDRLFQRFTQAEEHKQRRREGTGLGLALVKEIADRHGWLIDADGRPGSGAAFSIIMPLNTDRFNANSENQDNLIRNAGRIERAESGISFPVTSFPYGCGAEEDSILLIEDNPDMGAVLKDLLCSEYNLHWCISGFEALDYLKTSPLISLIICDVMMPGMSGFAFRETLIEKSSFSEIPFIFLTALADPKDISEGLETGAVDYIQKPFVGAELLLKIKNIILSHKASYLQALRDQQGADRLSRLSSGKTVNKSDLNRVEFEITKAERRVAELVKQGLQDKEIAAELSISPRTVSSHLSHLYQKTDTQNRVELLNRLFK